MADVSQRNRVAAGVPQGGEFACEQRGENGDLVVEPEPSSWEPRPIQVPSWGVDDAEARIAKANRRLERAGIEERFVATWGEPYQEKKDGSGEIFEYRDLTLNHPRLSYSGWDFVGSLDDLGDGDFILRTPPGTELDGYRPDAQRCDHCGRRQHRSQTYLVRHEDGTIKQVGSTCIQDFLGVEPKGLWAIGFDPMEDAEDDWEGGYSGGGETLKDTRMVIATALVLSEGGTRYQTSYDGEGTGAQVKNVLWGQGGREEEKRWRAEIAAQARAMVDSGEVNEVITAVKAMQGDSDYATNLRTLIGKVDTDNGAIRIRHAGLVASSVTQLGRWRSAQAKEVFPRLTEGFLAPEGTKMKDLSSSDGKPGVKVMIDKVTGYESYYGYPPKWIQKIIMRDETGHTLTVDTTAQLPDLKEGEVWRLSGGSVKRHGNYRGTDQTEIKLPKFEAIEPLDAPAEPRQTVPGPTPPPVAQ